MHIPLFLLGQLLSESAPILQVKVPAFSLSDAVGVVEVNNYQQMQFPVDAYPPSQVRDLRISGIDVDKREVELTWTATGDEWDFLTGRSEETECNT